MHKCGHYGWDSKASGGLSALHLIRACWFGTNLLVWPSKKAPWPEIHSAQP